MERFDTSYEKNGVSNIFLSFEPLTGKRWVNVSERRTRLDWAMYIQDLVEVHYPEAKKIILVVDNLNIHTGAALYQLLEPAHARKIVEKLDFHFTPKHGSWLNMAEIELSHLFRQCLNRRLVNVQEVREETSDWMEERNQGAYVINWQFTTGAIVKCCVRVIFIRRRLFHLPYHFLHFPVPHLQTLPLESPLLNN